MLAQHDLSGAHLGAHWRPPVLMSSRVHQELPAAAKESYIIHHRSADYELASSATRSAL